MTRVVVLGIGNRFRGDDGAGLEVLDALGPRLGPAVEVRALDGEPARVVEAWDGADVAIVVDALRSDDPPGARHRVEGLDDDLDARLAAWSGAGGSHALGVSEALRLGRALGRLPRRLVVHGVTGERFDLGTGCSPAVRSALPALVEQVAADVALLAGTGAAAGEG